MSITIEKAMMRLGDIEADLRQHQAIADALLDYADDHHRQMIALKEERQRLREIVAI